jgi:hypothetical protein
METEGSSETVMRGIIFQKAIIFNYVLVLRINDGVMLAEINDGSCMPPFYSECMEERSVFKLL